MQTSFYVYVHSRFSTGEPFYVGKGRMNRVYAHAGRSAHWKRIVAKDGGRHINVIAETRDEELAFLIEMEAIDRYRRMGAELINKTAGGEGMSGYRMTPEQRANQGRAKLGNKFNVGRRHSDETRARMSAAQKKVVRKKHTDEHKRNIGLASLGNKYCLGKKASDETRAKLSAAKKGKQMTIGHTLTAEHRAKLVAAHQNRSQAEREEISRKLSASTKAIWAARKAQK